MTHVAVVTGGAGAIGGAIAAGLRAAGHEVAFAPGMAQRGFGRIVFVASDTVWDPPGSGLVMR
jgi:NAD(P)-dependent dehydrogenase (short-subunit alcohol dehydrogenase family)